MLDAIFDMFFLWALSKEARERRAGRSKSARRRRWLRKWAGAPEPRRPIPDLGYRCERCDYPLAGLTVPTCPECGASITP